MIVHPRCPTSAPDGSVIERCTTCRAIVAVTTHEQGGPA